MNNSVCVLGASGFVGSNLLSYLEDNNIPSFGISRSLEKSNVYKIKDYSNTDELSDILSEANIVVNAIGSFKPKDFYRDIDNPFAELGRVAWSIEKAIQKKHIDRFIQISSAGTVYGHGGFRKKSEIDIAIPETWYGRIKLLEECYYKQICEINKISYICARITNPFGNTRTKKHGFVDVLAKSISNGEPFYTYKEDSHKRDFIHVKDMARIICGLALSDKDVSSETFNIGSGESVSLHELARFVNQYCNNVVFDLEVDKSEINIVDINIEKVERFVSMDWRLTSPKDFLYDAIKTAGY